MGRDLTSNELALLEWLLLDPEVPDADALRAQVRFAQVVEGEPRLPSIIHLSVAGALPASLNNGHVPGGAVVEDASGQPTGFLDLWVKDGYLSSIEHSWVTDEMPEVFPPVERLRRWQVHEVHDARSETSA